MPTLTKIGRNTIQDSAISTAQLEDGSVAVADIGTNAVGNDELINSESYTVQGLTTNASVQSKAALTVGDATANTSFAIPAARGTQDQVLKYPASGTTLSWGNISVSGYDGVAWFYKVESAQTIPVNKAIVVPGPLEIASGGTVTVNGRLHII